MLGPDKTEEDKCVEELRRSLDERKRKARKEDTPAGPSAVLAQRVQSLEEAQEGLAKREGDKGSEGLDRGAEKMALQTVRQKVMTVKRSIYTEARMAIHS